jgi:large subunit ribosomal protein L25
MAQTELNVAARETLGKGGARSLRRQGLVPAIVYGRGAAAHPVTVAPKALAKAIATEAGWNTLITLRGVPAVDGKVVILKETQVDPIRNEVTHADFQVIDVSQRTHVTVPLHIVGKSEGEKLGGTLQMVRHDLDVVCLPTAIPAVIDVDVTALAIGDVLHVKDIVLPAGVEAHYDVNFTVVTVTGHKAEEAAEGGEEEAEA